MAITIALDGEQYTGFISASITEQLDALSNSFAMEIATDKTSPIPFLQGSEVQLFVNGDLKLTGVVEVLDGSYSATSHELNLAGRDLTSDLVDSTLDVINQIVPPITVSEIAEIVIRSINSKIGVRVKTVTSPFNVAEDAIVPERGQNAYEFLQNIALKRQVLLSSDADGNLVLTRSEPTTTGATLQNVVGASDNNIMSGNFSFDSTERFRDYICAAQLNLGALNFLGKPDLTAAAGTSAKVIDSIIKPGRQLCFKPDKASSNEQNQDRVAWELNMRKARSMRFNATVNGHAIGTDSTELWETNTLIMVRDDFAGIDGLMLVNKVTFSTDITEGDTTEIELIPRFSYTLQTQEPAGDTNEVGSGLTLQQAISGN